MTIIDWITVPNPYSVLDSRTIYHTFCPVNLKCPFDSRFSTWLVRADGILADGTRAEASKVLLQMVLFFHLSHHQPSLLVLRRCVTQSDLSWAEPRSVCFLHTQPPHCPTNIRATLILIAVHYWDFAIGCYLALSWPQLTETGTKSEFKLWPLTPNPYSLFLCHTKTQSRTFSKITLDIWEIGPNQVG